LEAEEKRKCRRGTQVPLENAGRLTRWHADADKEINKDICNISLFPCWKISVVIFGNYLMRERRSEEREKI
jgi:hypothetical protein